MGSMSLRIKELIIKLRLNGFTLIEVIVVIAVLGILAGIAVPRYVGYVDVAKKTVCRTNAGIVERHYHAKIVMDKLEHTEAFFEAFLDEYVDELCPSDGLYSYVDGHVECSVHSIQGGSDSGSSDDGSGSGDDGEVPYL